MKREESSCGIEIQVSARWGGEASGLGVACPLWRRHLSTASTSRPQLLQCLYVYSDLSVSNVCTSAISSGIKWEAPVSISVA